MKSYKINLKVKFSLTRSKFIMFNCYKIFNNIKNIAQEIAV